MRKIICFILLGMNFLTGYSQTEWKFVGGIDLTPVHMWNREEIYQNGYIYNSKSTSNLAYLGIGVCFGGEKVRLEATVGSAFYKDTYQAQLEKLTPNSNGIYVFVKDSILYLEESKVTLPMFRASMNFSMGMKSTLKLLAFNHGKSTLNAGLAFERKIGEKFSVSASIYAPVKSLEPFYLPESNIGAGMQLSYVFARKEKLKKEKLKNEKSNSSPTVL
jgi:hypothetical protein